MKRERGDSPWKLVRKERGFKEPRVFGWINISMI